MNKSRMQKLQNLTGTNIKSYLENIEQQLPNVSECGSRFRLMSGLIWKLYAAYRVCFLYLMFIFHGLPHTAGDFGVIKAGSDDGTRFPDRIYVKFLLFTERHEYERALPG